MFIRRGYKMKYVPMYAGIRPEKQKQTKITTPQEMLNELEAEKKELEAWIEFQAKKNGDKNKKKDNIFTKKFNLVQTFALVSLTSVPVVYLYAFMLKSIQEILPTIFK